jgi:hypothetical protein
MGDTSKVEKRGTVVPPVEIYAPERKAEFLLTNAVNREDYRQAQADVRRMGLDVSQIRHGKPSKGNSR